MPPVKSKPAPPAPKPAPAAPAPTADANALPPVIVNAPAPPAPAPAPGPDVRTIVHNAPSPSVIMNAPSPAVTAVSQANDEHDDPIEQELTISELRSAQAPPPPPPPAPATRNGNPAIRTVVQKQIPEGGSAGFVDSDDLDDHNEDGVRPGADVSYEDQQRIIRAQKAAATK